MAGEERQESFLDLVPEVKTEEEPQTGNDSAGYRKSGKPHPHQHFSGPHAVQIGGAPSTLLKKEVKSVVKGD